MKEDGRWAVASCVFVDEAGLLKAAKREFEEETGTAPPDGEFLPLKPIEQSSGKTVYAWAVNGDFDPANLRSNMFPMEWPPNTGKLQQFPEIDSAAWLTPGNAKRKQTTDK